MNVNYLNENVDLALYELNKRFPEYSKYNSEIINELLSLVSEEPDIIIFIFRDEIQNEDITTFITQPKNKENSILNVMSSISICWEVPIIFKLASYLLSKKNVKIQNLKESSAIYIHFKKLGLSSLDIEKMRIIRNAKNHKFSVQKDKLITSNKNIPEMSFSEVLELNKKLENLFSWWVTALFYQIIFIPNFGILVFYSIIDKLTGIPKVEFRNYVEALNQIIPDFDLHKSNTVLFKARKNLIKKFKNIRVKLKKIFLKNSTKFSIVQYMKNMYEWLLSNPQEISEHLKIIAQNIKNSKDKEYFYKISENFSNFNGKLISEKDLEIILNG